MDNGAYGTLLEFTGDVSVVNGQKFTVTHDDGLTLVIGGVDLGFNAGPTPPHHNDSDLHGTDWHFPIPIGLWGMLWRACCFTGRSSIPKRQPCTGWRVDAGPGRPWVLGPAWVKPPPAPTTSLTERYSFNHEHG